MNMKNNKTLIGVVSTMTVAVLIITGTFAWRTIQQAITGGRNETLEYVVMLLEDDYKPIYKLNNWRTTDVVQLQKPVYASSKCEDGSLVKTEYERILQQYDEEDLDEPVFSDTWVRIKIEEYFSHNGSEVTRIANKIDVDGKLISSFTETDGGYFAFENTTATEPIVTLTEWSNKISTDEMYNPHGRFWILDEATGWMYWAQPVLAPTEGTQVADQETDHIIDTVKLTKQPSGSWDYKVKATLEAMDVELNGYEDEGTWSDIAPTDDLYMLFGDVVIINSTNFPDADFRTYLSNGKVEANTWDDYLSSYAQDKKLTRAEIDLITKINVDSKAMRNLKGLEYFDKLKELRAYNMPNLISLDVSNNPELTLLNVASNPFLSSIDVSSNQALKILHAANNLLLTSIDVSRNPALTRLTTLNSPSLTSITLGTKEYLTTLQVENNQLSSLDISGCTILNKTDPTYFTYDPQLDEEGNNKVLKVEVVASTTVLEWE